MAHSNTVSLVRARRTIVSMAFIAFLCGLFELGCARLPYTTRTLHEDERALVSVQKEVKPQSFTHPVHLDPVQIERILRGFSIRAPQRLPLRWFAEELPPKPLLREDELRVLTPYLAEALGLAGADERVYFEVRNPGFNPSIRRDVVGGWMAVRDPYLYLQIDYFHSQIPTRKADLYDYNYPTPPPPPRDYILYFEPGRFWTTDEAGRHAVRYREFLKSGEAGGGP